VQANYIIRGLSKNLRTYFVTFVVHFSAVLSNCTERLVLGALGFSVTIKNTNLLPLYSIRKIHGVKFLVRSIEV
jgi:hypothetical protein